MNATEGLDRREFLLGTGATIVASALPVALVATAPAVGDTAPRAQLADWHVDDMWGVYPRPHEAIGYGRPQGDGERMAAVHPADVQFVG